MFRKKRVGAWAWSRRDRRGSRRKMIPYGRKREKRERRLEQLLESGATSYRNCYLITARLQIPRCTCNQDTWFGRVVWHGKARQGMHIQAYSGIFSCESELLLCRDLISPHRNKR